MTKKKLKEMVFKEFTWGVIVVLLIALPHKTGFNISNLVAYSMLLYGLKFLHNNLYKITLKEINKFKKYYNELEEE